MIKLSKEEFLTNKQFYINEMKDGKIFIYPTDTIYGIGCDATNENACEKVRKIKQRDPKPFSTLVPSIDWLFEKAVLNDAKKHLILVKLPGKYTFILNLKNDLAISRVVNMGLQEIGARVPDMWFSDIITEFDGPFVTTSVNLSGQPCALRISDVDSKILKQVDYVIEDDECISGRASMVIDLREEEMVILRK